MFYAFAGFSVQAAFYFIYRAVFEDSSDHRRQLKRMRNKNRQRMAKLKFEQEKAQLESVLNQQMGIYQRNLGAAMADNVITPQESEVLAGNLDTINQLMAQIQLLQAQVAKPQQQQQVQRQPVTPESLGIDRHRIMGIPVGPKLTGRVLADIISRLDRIESEPTRDTGPSSGWRRHRCWRKPPTHFNEV